jgi:hypothetical protein
LKTSANQDEVRELLQNLEIVLAAHATDAVPQETGNKASASGKHDLTSRTIPASENVDIVSVREHTYVLWKANLHLQRPRARLQRPAIYFTAHLTLNATSLSSFAQPQNGLLKSFEPLPANVLEPLRFDPALSESNIYLSENRITKVAPSATRLQEDVKPVRGASKRAFPIVPAMFTRIRYTALPDAVVASLHLETTQLINGTLEIKEVALDAPDARVESLCPLDSPKGSRAGDEMVLLYKLKAFSEGARPAPAAIFVKIEASVSMEHRSHTKLEIRWQAQVDLSQTWTKPTYKWSRPLSGSKQLQVRPSSEGTVRLPSIDASQAAAGGDGGITFNFTAAPTLICDEDFKLDVQCINRSARSRRFALVVLQPKRTHGKQRKSHENSEDTNLIAGIFRAPPLERQRAPEVLDLNPDVRIGPLPPGACFEAQMKFRALATGVLDIGVIRVVDLDTRQTVDVRELPDIISLEKLPSGGEVDEADWEYS